MTKFAIFLAIAASALSTPTVAAERTADIRVAYADLQLASKAGRAALDRRITAAIGLSCGVDERVQNLHERRAVLRCIHAKQAEVAPARAAVLAAYGAQDRVVASAY